MFEFFLWPSRLEERLPLGEKRSLDILDVGNLSLSRRGKLHARNVRAKPYAENLKMLSNIRGPLQSKIL